MRPQAVEQASSTSNFFRVLRDSFASFAIGCPLPIYFVILIDRSRNSFVYVLFTSNGLSMPMYSFTRA